MKAERPVQVEDYVNVTYEQFNQTKFITFLRKLCIAIALPFLYPLILLSRLSDRFFLTVSESISLIPFLFGIVIREAFFKKMLDSCGDNLVIEFGAYFYYKHNSVGDNVLISAYTTIHHCDIGSNVLIGGGCRLLSGSRQHNYNRTDIPMTQQGGQMKRIRIGNDVWIGDNSVIMSDIEEGCIIGAGSVVTKQIPAYSVCAGNPATVIMSRK
ncbi:acyltransferase [bacterium]|nr:acyltransferase [bacterium]